MPRTPDTETPTPPSPFPPFVPAGGVLAQPAPNGAAEPPVTRPKRDRTRRAAPAKPKRMTGKEIVAARPKRTTVRTLSEHKQVVASLATIQAERQKRTRRPRQPRAMKIDMATALSVASGLKETDAQMLSHLSGVLQGANKKSRQKIVAALGKLFA